MNEGYGLLNGRLTQEYQAQSLANPVRFSLWGENLMNIDDQVYTSAIGSSSSGYFGSNYFHAEPYSYGVDLEFSF